MRNWFIGIEDETKLEHLAKLDALQQSNTSLNNSVNTLTKSLETFSYELKEIATALASLNKDITVPEAPSDGGVYARGNSEWHELVVNTNEELTMHSTTPILENRFYQGKGNDVVSIKMSGLRCTINDQVQPPVRSITWTADKNLPSGLSINSSTGEISGTVAREGTEGNEISSIITCRNNYGSSDCIVKFVITPAPSLISKTFTKTTNDTINETVNGSYITEGINGITSVKWEAENVPSGLTFNKGTFTGTPKSNFNGATIVTVTTNGGTATANIEWNIIGAPSLSGRTVTATTADNVNVTLVSKNVTEGVNGVVNVLWEVTAVPQGLTFKNGGFSGKPVVEHEGVSVVTVSTNAGTASANVIWNISYAKPSIESKAISKHIGEEVNHTIEGRNITMGVNGITSVVWKAEDIPAGLEFNNGAINGTTTEEYHGTSLITVTTNGGIATAVIDWDIA